jgi:hypothetical protein
LQKQAFLAALGPLRSQLQATGKDLLTQAYKLGVTQAHTELESRGLRPAMVYPVIGAELDTWQKRWDSQLSWVELQLRNGADPAEVVGDRSRVGSLSAAPVIALGALLLTGATLAGWLAKVERTKVPKADPDDYWWKQAIATIDKKTTNCCLGVHGQVRPLRYAFSTPGQPHFALRQKWAPFHYYCRTVTVMLYEDEAKDGHTKQLIAEAKLQLKKNKK